MKIKPTDLRVGNLIIANGLYEGKIVEVEQIGSKGTLSEGKRVLLFKNEHAGEFLDDCIGIPSTEEWLVRFGFEKVKSKLTEENNKLQVFAKKGFRIRLFGIDVASFNWGVNQFFDTNFNADYHDDYYDHSIETPYVHQIQNLYHSLTGEELILEQR